MVLPLLPIPTTQFMRQFPESAVAFVALIPKQGVFSADFFGFHPGAIVFLLDRAAGMG